ncbi:MAG TPA: hypothetical protein PLK54_10220 [Ferruginibacter sp.]|nr:hypothetical protein [Ferruginibacter sp.]
MLKRSFLPLLLIALISCGGPARKEPTTDMEVARAFVRNILDNKFDEAEKYLLKDQTNADLFNRFKQQYSAQRKEQLEKYKDADIIVNETSYVTDSIFIFNYSNSYALANKNKLKLVRIGGKWLVDFQYTFSGNM